MEDLKYPIAYAPMPIKEFRGYDIFEEPNFITSCYIAAPCYILCQRKHYHEDGTNSIDYEIVFCNEVNVLNVKEVTPQFNREGYCNNSIITDEIDFEFSKVFDMCESKNHQLLLQKYISNSSSSYDDMLKYYTMHIENLYQKLNYDYKVLKKST